MKRVENTMGKGEIARSHSVFKRSVLQTCKNQGLFGKGLIATFPLSSAASLNLGPSQNDVLRNGLKVGIAWLERVKSIACQKTILPHGLF